MSTNIEKQILDVLEQEGACTETEIKHYIKNYSSYVILAMRSLKRADLVCRMGDLWIKGGAREVTERIRNIEKPSVPRNMIPLNNKNVLWQSLLAFDLKEVKQEFTDQQLNEMIKDSSEGVAKYVAVLNMAGLIEPNPNPNQDEEITVAFLNQLREQYLPHE